MRHPGAAMLVLLILACGTHAAPPPEPEPSPPPVSVPAPPSAPPIEEPAPAAPPPVQPPGAGFDEAAAARVIRQRSGDVRRCYEARLRSTPALHGRVEVAFTVLPTGRVDGVHASSNDTGDAQLADCIVE